MTNVTVLILVGIILIYIFTRLFPIKKEKKDKIFLKIAFIFFFIILAIRKPISDMENYFQYFHYISNTSRINFLNLDLEFLYKVLNFFIAKIWENERFFMIIIDIIGLTGVYYYIKKYSDNYLLSLIFFISIGTYYMHFFILRQTIAIAIILFSIRYIKERKFWKFLVCIIIASGFHKSSIVFIIAYWICNIKITKDYITVCGIFYVILFIMRNVIISSLAPILYDQYSQNVISGEGYGRLLIFIVILIYSLIIGKQLNGKEKGILIKRNENDLMSIFTNLTILTIAFQILATKQSITSRMANIFCMGAVILVTNSTEQVKDKKIKSMIIFLILIVNVLYAILQPSIIGYEIFNWFNL